MLLLLNRFFPRGIANVFRVVPLVSNRVLGLSAFRVVVPRGLTSLR